MEIFGVDIVAIPAHVVRPVVGATVAAAGFMAGRWSQHRRHVRFKREDLVTSSIVIEFYGVKSDGGRDVLHIISQGGSFALDGFFRSPDLVGHVQRAARKHPGLMRLANPVAHRMMMDEGKDAITGLDAKANMDFLHGRPTQDDETLFAFASYAEKDHDGSGLRDQIARLEVMVVSPDLIGRLADPAYVMELAVAHSGYHPRCQRLHEFALEWLRLMALPPDQRSSAADKIWQITVRTSLR